MPEGYKARPERVILFTVRPPCELSQHIPQRFDAADVTAVLAQKDKEIAAFKAEVETLKAA